MSTDLEREIAAIEALWTSRLKELEDEQLKQMFLRDSEHADTWIGAQEMTLANEDLGDSLDSVEALSKMHDDFEKSVMAQEDKFVSLQKFAERLVAENHADAAELNRRCQTVLEHSQSLSKSTESRRSRLDASQQLQELKRDIDEAEAWIAEKMQVASDDAYADSHNLRAKLKNHEAFAAELAANDSRIAAVTEAGAVLVSANHYASVEINASTDALRSQWEALRAKAAERGQKLREANQHQDFTRRVEDIESWCGEVEQSLATEDMGKDLASVQTLLKKHQLLEAEIAGHQDRIDMIAEQAKEMVAAGNFQSAVISHRSADVTARYAAFAKPVADRRAKLEDALQLQQVFRDIDDEESWIREKEPLAASPYCGNNLTSVQNLQKKHNALQAELAGRQKAVTAVCDSAKSLIKAGNYAARDIQARLDAFSAAWDKLNVVASDRKVALEEALRTQQFFADCNEAEAWMAEKEPIVASEDFGKDEDSALALLKKHEAVEADLRTYQTTVTALTEESRHCKDLQASATDGGAGSPSKGGLTTARKVVAMYKYEAKQDKQISMNKGDVLSLLSKDTADWWRVEKDGRVGFVPANFVKERETESTASPSLGGSSSRNSFAGSAAPATASVKERLSSVESQYQRLVDFAAQRHLRLEESQQLYLLNREVDEVESWMNDREAVATVQDIGADLEHNEVLQKKFVDFTKDLKANETRINVASELANKFIKQGHSDKDAIQARQTALNNRWDALQETAKARADALSTAHDVHKFNRDADETKARFAEKDVILSSDDYGKDLAGVEALQRKHDGAMRDLIALEAKVTQLSAESARLVAAYPNSAAEVERKQTDIDASWAGLQDKATARKQKLADSHQLQQFLSDHRDLTSWIAGMQALASSDELAKDAAGAEALLKRHQELRAEVDARNEGIVNITSRGDGLVAGNHYAATEVKACLDELKLLVEQLESSMSHRKVQLEQCLELQLFSRMAERAEAWVATREAPLQTSEVGTTLDGVEAAQKKHGDFEKSIGAQKEKIIEVVNEADRLVTANHYDAVNIGERKEAVLARWDHLLALADVRKARLSEALELQQFHRDADEAEAWMNEKTQAASDPSYKDPTNLQSKLQKHQAFEAEVTANEARIFTVMDAGRALLADATRTGTESVSPRIQGLEKQWQSLRDQSAIKAQKLKEANQQQQYNHGVDDVEFWLSEVEVLLSSGDLGKDLASVQNLLKKHQLLEADVAAHSDRVESVSAAADSFVQSGHFDADAISAKCKSIVSRYEAVKAQSVERRTKLVDSHRLQQVFRDIDDEEAWIRERERIASSNDFGKDLTGVQDLQKKHQAFDGELGGHERRVEAVIAAAAGLVADAHYATAEIRQRKQALESAWSDLKSLSESRRRSLDESLQYQMFNADIDEEESWINEKVSMMSNEDAHDTLSGAQALVKKHEAFEADLIEHEDRVASVCDEGTALVKAKNYQAAAINASISKIEALLDGLLTRADARKVSLNDRFKFLQFSREADSIEAWIKDKQPQATSNDYGKDLASVQGLIGKHDAFDASLTAFQSRIDALAATRDELVSANNSRRSDVQARERSVATKLWSELRAAAQTRKDALGKSQLKFQQVDDLFLEFAQKSSQFNSWFENAEEDLTDPVRVNSLDEIEALRSAHSQFMDSLGAAREKFDHLVELGGKVKSLTSARNPYTWFTVETLEDSWENLMDVIQDRDEDLGHELRRQQDNESLRKLFAKHANEFSLWLTATRQALVEGTGTLEAQLEATKVKYAEVLKKKVALKSIEDLGAKMEEALILDNKYTEHSTVGLAQQWDQLEQLGMRMQHNLEQQIQAKNTTGVSEEQLKDFNETFRYFDKDNSGKLDHQELKSCLRSLGYRFAVVEEGEKDPEFEAILAQMDPNNDGYVSLSEFLSFMISRATENVESATEVINAFKAAAGDNLYVTAEQLRSVLTDEQADYCVRHMQPYRDPKGVVVKGGYDYKSFTQGLFTA